jgi:poly(A) polymerase
LSQPSDLTDYLNALRDRGVEAAVTGPAALALLRGTPLPARGPLTVVARVPGQTSLPDPPDRLSVQRLVHEGPFAEGLQASLAAEPVRAFAVAIDTEGRAHDPLGGLADAEEGRLRLQGDARAFLRGDASRVLDLAVWAARSGLKPTPDAVRTAWRDAGNVLQLDRAVWCERFGEVLLGDKAGTGLQFLHDAGVLQLMVPEVVAMVDFHKSCPVHHKDIWDHTLQVVEKCPQVLTVRWAALMHDTGKVWTRTVNKQGKVHFFRHEEMGASLMEGVAGRFHLDPELRDRVVYIIANHARANVYATNWTDSAVRRLIRDMGEHLADVLAFSQSDFTTKRAWRIAEVRSLAEELNTRIPRIAAEDAKIPPLPKGLGHVIMQATGLQPGPWLGEVQHWLEAEVEAGAIEARLEAEAYLAHVRDKRPELLAIDPGKVRERRRA